MSGLCGLLSGPEVTGVIENQLSTITSKGDTAYATALEAMQQMAAIFDNSISEVGAWSPGTPGGGNTEAIQFIKPTPRPNTPSGLSIPNSPSIGGRGIDDLEDSLNNILQEIQALIDSFPSPPNVVVEDRFLSYLASFYNQLSGQLTDILNGTPIVLLTLSRLEEWLQPGAVGIPSIVEQALRDRGLYDIDVALTRAKQEALDERAAMGFSYPDGVLDIKLARLDIDAADQRGKLNREVLIKAAEWERDTRKFGIETGLAYDSKIRDSFFKLYEESRAIATTWQENHIKVRLAILEVYKAQVDGLGKAASSLDSMGGAVAAAIKAKLDAARIDIEIYDAKLKGEIERGGFDLKRFGEEIELYKQDVISESARVDILGKNDERLLSREKINADIDIKSKELELQKLVETARVVTQALDGVARTASQLAGSVYSALNMSAGISARTDYTNSSSCATHYNISQ